MNLNLAVPLTFLNNPCYPNTHVSGVAEVVSKSYKSPDGNYVTQYSTAKSSSSALPSPFSPDGSFERNLETEVKGAFGGKPLFTLLG